MTYKITIHDLQRWKENSLDLADQMEVLKMGITRLIDRKIEVNLVGGKTPPHLIYGYTAPFEAVYVYEQNPASSLPKALREIYNQSGMDHEIIGHMGNCLSGKRGDEVDAWETQIAMAKKRAETSYGWKFAEKTLPIVRDRVKQVKHTGQNN